MPEQEGALTISAQLLEEQKPTPETSLDLSVRAQGIFKMDKASSAAQATPAGMVVGPELPARVTTIAKASSDIKVC